MGRIDPPPRITRPHRSFTRTGRLVAYLAVAVAIAAAGYEFGKTHWSAVKAAVANAMTRGFEGIDPQKQHLAASVPPARAAAGAGPSVSETSAPSSDPPFARANIPSTNSLAGQKSCSDQVAAILPKVEPLIFDFKRETEIALSTPRISLAAEVSKLEAIWHTTMTLDGWPENSCGYRLREKLGLAEAFDVERLKVFMGGSNQSRSEKSMEFWDDAERQLREMQTFARATTSN